MSLSAVTTAPPVSGSDPAASDVRVKTLQAQIQDWATCPTTDPQTKASKVARLQSQLDAVEASIKSKPPESAPVQAPQSKQPGLGRFLDFSA